VGVTLAPASEADIAVFRRLPLDVPEGATIFADKGYLDQHEEALLQGAGIRIIALRRANSRVPLPAWLTYIVQHERKRIETVFSQIAAAFGRTIHAVTPRGFELKVFLTVLAYSAIAGL
jgi:IS5 family transposase